MRIDEWITEKRGGIAHARDAVRAGFTEYAIKTAVRADLVSRVRRVWLTTPAAHPELRRAAAAGGKLACVTAAAHHGLWTLADGRFHLAFPAHAGRALADASTTAHWSDGPIRGHRFELVEPVVNALWHIAHCQPFEHALATWESAVRSGRVTIDLLERIPMRSAAGRRVLTACSQLSDSGIESIPVARLARIGIMVRQQVRVAGHRVDGLIGERLILQIDGYGFHRSAEQRAADIAHDRALRLMGYTVLRYDYRQVLSSWDAVEEEIRTAIAQSLHIRGAA